MANQRNLKAFVRYDGSGRVVAGSLVLRKKKPKVGRWKEILTYECCNLTTTTTTTGVPVSTCDTYFNMTGSPFATISYTDCNNVEVVNAEVNITTSVCVMSGTVTGEIEAFEVYPNTCFP
jgi:hypothetical protein